MIAAFPSEFWVKISSPLCLLLPDNSSWLLNWIQHDDTHVLLNNWKGFSEAYSLNLNQVLHFKFVEDSYPISIFSVSIFNQNGSEIEYPMLSNTISPWEIKPTKPAIPSPGILFHTIPKEEPHDDRGTFPFFPVLGTLFKDSIQRN
jgi:hypothetical protein